MNSNLRNLYQELLREDKDNFRSQVISRLFPEVEEASKRINSRLDKIYEQKFENKSW